MTVKISAMTSGSTPAGTELLEAVQGGNTRSLTVSQIALLAKTLAQLSTQISDAVIARTDAGQTFTGSQVFAAFVMGGHTMSDILISTDGLSGSDAALISAGYVDALFQVIGDAPTAHNLNAHGTATKAQLDAIVSDATLARTDAGQTFTGVQTFGTSMALGGHTIADVLISTDGANTDDDKFVTPGWIDTNVSAGGGTLDTAYDFGGAGAGRTITVDTGAVNLDQPAIATGVPEILRITGGALTNLTLSTEVSDVVLDLSHTVEWATGALAAQSAMRILAPTYAFVGASTIADAATLRIDDAPTAGTNATLTNSYALWVAAGKVRIDGPVVHGAGAVGAPSIALLGSLTTGWYSPGANDWTYVRSGSPLMALTFRLVTVTGDVLPNVSDSKDLGATGTRWRAINGKSLNLEFLAIATAETVGILTANTTAAAAGAQQHAPMFVQEGQGWRTDATAETQAVAFAQQVIPVEGTASPTGRLDFKASIDGGAYSDVLSINSVGDLKIIGALDHDGATIGFYGTTPTAQSAAYTINATAAPDRTLLASASATTINNNNVLAALIADLQLTGVLG